MNDPDDFLSRWSRRKQDAARAAKHPRNDVELAKSVVRDDVPSDRPEPDTKGLRPASNATEAEPIFDLSKLPSLDSIGPESNVRLFMQPGVPASLSRAALRRAWSSDPAIRDFIGLSENSWDFTKPESIAGFGPLLPIDDVKTLLARVFRDDEPAHPRIEATALQHEPFGEAEQSATREDADENADLTSSLTEQELGPETLLQSTNADAASMHEQPAENAALPILKRRHGGALPT